VRNQILFGLIEKGNIKTGHQISDMPYFWGWDINFKYNGKKYQWNADNHIYLLNRNWERVKNKKEYIKISCDDISEDNIGLKLDSLCQSYNPPSDNDIDEKNIIDKLE
jgi:spermidine/putrescine-binding protein